jgi:hypothetical protein
MCAECELNVSISGRFAAWAATRVDGSLHPKGYVVLFQKYKFLDVEFAHIWGWLTDNLSYANDIHTVCTVRAGTTNYCYIYGAFLNAKQVLVKVLDITPVR